MDQEDAASYKQGEEVTLLRWGNVTITGITAAADGKVTALKVQHVMDVFVCICVCVFVVCYVVSGHVFIVGERKCFFFSALPKTQKKDVLFAPWQLSFSLSY